MISLSSIINVIRSNVIATPIYRTVAPLDVAFPVVTISLDGSTVDKALNGDIKIESLQISVNVFGLSPASVDTLSDTITDRLMTLTGTTGSYTISGFYLQNRKSGDYADQTSNKLVYGNIYEYKMTVKKS